MPYVVQLNIAFTNGHVNYREAKEGNHWEHIATTLHYVLSRLGVCGCIMLWESRAELARDSTDNLRQEYR